MASPLPHQNAPASAPLTAARDEWPRLARVEQSPAPGFRRLATMFRALRPHQWSKNLLLFVPVVLAHRWDDPAKLALAACAFTAFCLCASAVYLVNDVADIDADRRHPTKRTRPVAAGEISRPTALILAALLILAAFAFGAATLSGGFSAMLAAYLFLAAGYSLRWKKLLFLDVMLLAGLYTHRVLAGGVATEIAVSPWLMAFAVFFFLGLALLKRFVELRRQDPATIALARRGYLVEDMEILQTIGLVSGYLSVLVLCLYISQGVPPGLYHEPRVLWLAAPVLLYWISRAWLLARRGGLPDDPVVFACRDPVSYGSALACLALVLTASWKSPWW